MLLRMLLEQRRNLQYVSTTVDQMFRKIFYLWWFDKLHGEMDVIWFLTYSSCDDFLWGIENVPTAVYIYKIITGTVQQPW